jgi:hypothetical protein
MNRYLIPLRDEEVDGLARIRKRLGLASQELAQLVTAANPRLAGRAAVADKIRRKQLIEAPPVPLVDGLDERLDDGLIVLSGHGLPPAPYQTPAGWNTENGTVAGFNSYQHGIKIAGVQPPW